MADEARVRRVTWKHKVVRVALVVLTVVLGAASWFHSQHQSYYDDLVRSCARLKDRDCCWASVRAMRDGGWELVGIDDDWRRVCPKGTSPHTLLCSSSFQWCAPPP